MNERIENSGAESPNSFSKEFESTSFEKFVGIETLQRTRREAIRQSLRSIGIEELKNVAQQHKEEFVDDPWREKFVNLIAQHPHASFYHAVPQDGIEVFYCSDAEFGIWVLPGSGMGPLDAAGKELLKDAIERSVPANNPGPTITTPLTTLLVATGLLFFIGCSRKQVETIPPPPEVMVASVKSQDVAIEREGVATLEGFITAIINAQVQGYIISRDYKEGALIKKGDLLFQIDPRPYEAALAQAQGNLATARANRVKSEADVKRGLQLFQQKVISAQERDTYINAASVGQANVQAAEAAVKQAEINLGYTKITSPINGIVGIATAHVGDLVGPATGALTAISQVDPIKATVNLGEQSFTEFLTDHPDTEERERYLQGLRFDLLLGNGNLYSQKGEFYAEDRNIDTKTGAIKMELVFPNPGNRLRPGQFGKVRVVTKVERGALGIPQEAVTELQGSQVVGVVNTDKTVSMRPVKMGERVGAIWQVLAGLEPGEKVVVQGILKVRPGMPVAVKDWTPVTQQVASAAKP